MLDIEAHRRTSRERREASGVAAETAKSGGEASGSGIITKEEGDEVKKKKFQRTTLRRSSPWDGDVC